MTTWGYTYNKTTRRYEGERELTLEERRKMAWIMKKQQRISSEKEEWSHQHGICPHCFEVIPVNGKCPCQI
jgi:hypothetical protein